MKLEEFESLLFKTLKTYGDGQARKSHEFGSTLINEYHNKLDEIECLTHNIEVYKQREQIGIRRLEKVIKYLEDLGLSVSEINDIIRLEEENF